MLLGVDLVWQKVSLREFSQGPSLRDGKDPRQVICWDAVCERASLQTKFMCFHWSSPVGTRKQTHRRCQLGGGRGRYRGETSADAKAPLSAVCTVCTQDSKKSTGNLLVTLPDARGSGVKPEKQCTYWGNRVINAGRSPVARLRFRTPGPIGTAVYDPKS